MPEKDNKHKRIEIDAKPRAHEETRYVHFKYETSQAGVRKSSYVNVPMLEDDYAPIEVIKMLTEFGEARRSMHMTTGPELFENFRKLLVSCDSALEEWEAQVGAVGNPTVANFEIALEAFKSRTLRLLKYEEQLSYLRELKKPGAMKVDKFVKQFNLLNKLATQFPDAPADAAGIEAFEKKQLFYKAMPKSWQVKFHEVGREHYTSTVGTGPCEMNNRT